MVIQLGFYKLRSDTFMDLELGIQIPKIGRKTEQILDNRIFAGILYI